MSFAQSTIPAGYKLSFLLAQAAPEGGVFLAYAHTIEPDGSSTLKYDPAHFEAMEQAIAAYPTAYAAVLKPGIWQTVQAYRDELEANAAPTPVGHPIQVDDKSKAKILGVALTAALGMIEELVQASIAGRPFDPANLTFSEHFTMADNAVVNLDTFTAIAVAKAAGSYVSLVHARARQLRIQIDQAVTIAELEAIDINSGWPD